MLSVVSSAMIVPRLTAPGWKLLENNAYEVEEADGADALFHILGSHPDPSAILLDLTLNGKSGWDILRSLKADRTTRTFL